jgi:hypothetical protein
MAKSKVAHSEDDVLRRMLKTAPKPHAPLKAKAKSSRVSRSKGKNKDSI